MKKTDKQLNSKNGRKKAKLTPVPKTKYKSFKTNFDDDEDDFNFRSEKYQKSIADEDFDSEEDFDEEYEDDEEELPKNSKKHQKRKKQIELEDDFDEDDDF
jgi:hypothetical protein